MSFQIQLLLLLSCLWLSHAEFSQEDCVQCVGSLTTTTFNASATSTQDSNVYCEVSEDTFQCQDIDTPCDGESFLYQLECIEGVDDLIGLGQTILTVISILSCCCCIAIVGGIASCIYCCVRGSGPPPPGVPGAYQTQPPAVTLPGTMTTPAQTGLATAVQVQQQPNQQSIPFAEAVSMEKK